jgi:hypothetical protein
MSSHISKTFHDSYPLKVSPKQAQQLEIICQQFEIRNKHNQALNTPTLGVYPIYFTDKDATDIFDVFQINKPEFKKIINTIPSINKEFKVISDPFNMLVMWISHHLFISNLPKKDKDDSLRALFKMFYYRFFTSSVNHYLVYKTNEELMLLTVSELNNKYDIVKYGTWKKVIEAKVEELITSDSIHYRTLVDFNDDEKILYVISDCNTRIRLQLQRFIEAFNEMRENVKKDYILQNLMTETIDGQKILRNTTNVIDTMINNMLTRITNQEAFINNKYINDLIKQFKNIRADSFTRFLQFIINTTIDQTKTYDLDKVVIKNKMRNEVIYVGIRVFIHEFIQKTYRYCINNKVNMNSKRSIYLTVSNVYRSSRASDKDIANIKDSIHDLILKSKLSTRVSTITNYKIALVLYLLLLTFEDLV